MSVYNAPDCSRIHLRLGLQTHLVKNETGETGKQVNNSRAELLGKTGNGDYGEEHESWAIVLDNHM